MQVTWNLDNLQRLGGRPVTVVGTPRVIDTPHGPAVQFDGRGDQLVIDTNPLETAGAFTLEAIFRPDSGGAAEQRFVHIQQADCDDRILLETRLTPAGRWYADTFIRSNGAEVPLNDPSLLHDLEQWHTLALVCDGREMAQYVDGRRELSAPINYAPQGLAQVSLGARINRVYFFKGAIRTVRFTHRALSADALLRVTP